MARTRDVLSNIGQAGAQVGEALLKIATIKDQRERAAVSNAINMAQLDQANRRIELDHERLNTSIAQHADNKAANRETAMRAERGLLQQDIHNGLDLGEMSFNEALNKRMGGEAVGSWGKWNDSRAALRERQSAAINVEANINQAKQLSGLGFTSSGQPHSTPGLTPEQQAQHDMRWIDAGGTTFMSSVHPDWTPAEGERLFNHLQDMDLATLNDAERMKIAFTESALANINFGGVGAGGREPFNPAAATPTDTIPINLTPGGDSMGGAREGQEDSVLLAQPSSTVVNEPFNPAAAAATSDSLLTGAFQGAESSEDAKLRQQAKQIMSIRDEDGLPPIEVRGMTEDEVMEWIRRNPS